MLGENCSELNKSNTNEKTGTTSNMFLEWQPCHSSAEGLVFTKIIIKGRGEKGEWEGGGGEEVQQQ